MRILARCLTPVALVAVGYVVGQCDLLPLPSLQAQVGADGTQPSDETQETLRDALDSLKAAGAALRSEGLYKPATEGINTFGITVGGVNAMDDLEEGRGVDPETFAGLYAGQAVDEVAAHLDRDDQGRVTYKGRVVRLYPVGKLERLYQQRLKYAGIETDSF